MTDSVLRWMGWHWGRKACGYMKSNRACGLQNGAGQETDMRTGASKNPQQALTREPPSMSSTKIPLEQQNNLRELLCGCVWTPKRQFDDTEHAHRCASFCGEEPEDEHHMLWRCLQWETLRREGQAPSRNDRLLLPPCTSRCGIVLEDPEAVAWADAGLSVAIPCQ